ncbi:MAG: ribosome modulation factor [Gammaproteobacteria bacterium]|nr:ribosome modulation factor [Gammaproteobacteria bacterium]
MYSRGHKAGKSGKSKDNCPYINENQKLSWLAGWRDGRVDQWEGYTGVSGVHKIVNM